MGLYDFTSCSGLPGFGSTITLATFQVAGMRFILKAALNQHDNTLLWKLL